MWKKNWYGKLNCLNLQPCDNNLFLVTLIQFAFIKNVCQTSSGTDWDQMICRYIFQSRCKSLNHRFKQEAKYFLHLFHHWTRFYFMWLLSYSLCLRQEPNINCGTIKLNKFLVTDHVIFWQIRSYMKVLTHLDWD